MKNKIVLLLITVVASLGFTGCAGTGNYLSLQKTNAIGSDYRVILYSGGKPVREWQIHRGIVSEEQGSDGWYFNCQGSVVRISGDVVVEPLREGKQQTSDPVDCNQ